MELTKRFKRMGIRQRLTLTVWVLVLVPVLAFCWWLLESWREATVQERTREMEQGLYQVSVYADRTVEMCTLTTQTFLNTANLIDHLEKVQNQVSMTTGELLEFYRRDIAAMEKLLVSNPYLYKMRVYTAESEVQEMVPILYSGNRMKSLSWGNDDISQSCWKFDYLDSVFSENVPHIMSLVTPVTGWSGERLGTLEAAVRMDEVFPGLFTSSGNQWACLILDTGEIYGNSSLDTVGEQALDQLTPTEEPSSCEISENGIPYLVSAIRIEEMGAVYLQISSLKNFYASILARQLGMVAAFAGVAVLIFWCIRVLMKRMFRQLDTVLDGVRSFSEGNLDVQIQAETTDEIGAFSVQVNGLLENIRKLMQDNLERGLLVRSTEIRALQNQINAHFIYNVLEAIKMMAEIDEKYEIADAVTSLGKLLRYSMKWDRKTVALFEEIAYIQNYIALMNLRFDYELTFQVEVPDSLLYQEVPKISLQPIVENAVVHGAAALGRDSTVFLRGRVEGDCCLLEITDEGQGLSQEQLVRLERQIAGLEATRSTSGNGIGLKNVQDRIQMTFGEEYGLRVQSQPGHGTTIQVMLPYRKEKKAT